MQPRVKGKDRPKLASYAEPLNHNTGFMQSKENLCWNDGIIVKKTLMGNLDYTTAIPQFYCGNCSHHCATIASQAFQLKEALKFNCSNLFSTAIQTVQLIALTVLNKRIGIGHLH